MWWAGGKWGKPGEYYLNISNQQKKNVFIFYEGPKISEKYLL
jgi:hypothetical protein